MFYLKIIYYFYLFYTLLGLLAGINMPAGDVVCGLVLMWLLYFIFYIGSKQNRKKDENIIESKFTDRSSAIILFISLIITFLFPFYIKFYTGSSIYVNFINYFSGISTYRSYQEYFADAQLNVFTIKKLPYIIFGGIQKFFFIAVGIRMFCFKREKSLTDTVSFTLLLIIYFVSAICRGTFFEIFEVFILILYILILQRYRKLNKVGFSKKTLISITGTGVILTILFILNANQRSISNELDGPIQALNYNPDSLLARISPFLAELSVKLSGYFLFGIYFTSLCIMHVWFSSPAGFLSIFFPDGLNLFGIGDSYVNLICGRYTNCGAAWKADTILLIQNYGIIFLILLVFLIGKYSYNLMLKAKINSIPAALLVYFVFVFMISLPVGNFISSSSSNILAILFSLICLNKKTILPFLFKV